MTAPGTIIVARKANRTLSRAPKSNFARANAAIDADARFTRVVSTDTTSEFSVARWNGTTVDIVNKSRYAFRLILSGIHLIGSTITASLCLNDVLIIHRNGSIINRATRLIVA
ncbi:MAG: hypothetical protein BWY92_01630 [Firmicutes bacterium ADurb.BinA052]|nr:MAG: hypothetical protein BWY92_01630 [Firmicutes bacterium ADurb.BinA052]